MIETLYGDSFVLLGFWTATGLCLLFIYGLVAWVVVHLLARHEFKQGGPGRSTPGTLLRPSMLWRSPRSGSSSTTPGDGFVRS